MALTVKEITLWRGEIENQPGALARVFEPLAASGADLQVVMAYRYPGNESKGAVELYPVSGNRAIAAAQAAGLAPAESISALLVEGANQPGLGFSTSRAIAEAGVNLAFLVAQVVGTRFSAVYGFDNAADRSTAAGLLKTAGRRAPARPAAARKRTVPRRPGKSARRTPAARKGARGR